MMKSTLATFLACLALSAGAVTYTNVVNPPGAVTLAWDQHTDPTVTQYFVYYGAQPRAYTNRLAVAGITNTICTVSNLVRGVDYYFAITAFAAGLESDFSNEVTAKPRTPPSSPIQRPATILAVESKRSLEDPLWVDEWNFPLIELNPEQKFFRLRLVSN